MIRKLTTLDDGPFAHTISWQKSVRHETQLLVLYLFKNDYNHELKSILNYIFNATVWWQLDVNH